MHMRWRHTQWMHRPKIMSSIWRTMRRTKSNASYTVRKHPRISLTLKSVHHAHLHPLGQFDILLENASVSIRPLRYCSVAVYLPTHEEDYSRVRDIKSCMQNGEVQLSTHPRFTLCRKMHSVLHVVLITAKKHLG